MIKVIDGRTHDETIQLFCEFHSCCDPQGIQYVLATGHSHIRTWFRLYYRTEADAASVRELLQQLLEQQSMYASIRLITPVEHRRHQHQSMFNLTRLAHEFHPAIEHATNDLVQKYDPVSVRRFYAWWLCSGLSWRDMKYFNLTALFR